MFLETIRVFLGLSRNEWENAEMSTNIFYKKLNMFFITYNVSTYTRNNDFCYSTTPRIF